MVTVYAFAQNYIQAENRLFLQIKSGRILAMLWAFLINQLYSTRTGWIWDDYSQLISNVPRWLSNISYPTHTFGIIVNYMYIVHAWYNLIVHCIALSKQVLVEVNSGCKPCWFACDVTVAMLVVKKKALLSTGNITPFLCKFF